MELDVLAGGDVAEAARVALGDVGQRVELRLGQDALRNLHPQHLRVARLPLAVGAPQQPERPPFVGPDARRSRSARASTRTGRCPPRLQTTAGTGRACRDLPSQPLISLLREPEPTEELDARTTGERMPSLPDVTPRVQRLAARRRRPFPPPARRAAGPRRQSPPSRAAAFAPGRARAPDRRAWPRWPPRRTWPHSVGPRPASTGSSRTPAAARRSARCRPRPISTTTVAQCGARLSSIGRYASSACPETTTNPDAIPRCVTGIPASAGAAMAELIPGTTSKGSPAAVSASASSPPRPNTNGSPPFNRTTLRPRRAARIRSRLMNSWLTAGRPARLPTKIRCAAGASSSASRSTSAS